MPSTMPLQTCRLSNIPGRLRICYERQQCDVAGALHSAGQLSLLRFSQASLLAGFYLTKLVYVTLQGFEILVVKICYICTMLKNLCHVFSFMRVAFLRGVICPAPRTFLHRIHD